MIKETIDTFWRERSRKTRIVASTIAGLAAIYGVSNCSGGKPVAQLSEFTQIHESQLPNSTIDSKLLKDAQYQNVSGTGIPVYSNPQDSTIVRSRDNLLYLRATDGKWYLWYNVDIKDPSGRSLKGDIFEWYKNHKHVEPVRQVQVQSQPEEEESSF